MKHATVNPMDFDFLIWQHVLGAQHVVIFYHGVAIQHIVEPLIERRDGRFELDISHVSKLIGLTWIDAQKNYPHFRVSYWEAPQAFFNREDHLFLYLASRWEWAKDMCLPTRVSQRISKAIRGVK